MINRTAELDAELAQWPICVFTNQLNKTYLVYPFTGNRPNDNYQVYYRDIWPYVLVPLDNHKGRYAAKFIMTK